MSLAGYANTAFTMDRLVISLDDEVSRKVTLASGAGALLRGTLLGKITAGGKYLASLSAAVDGSQTPDCILAEDTDATSADKDTVAYFRGQFNDSVGAPGGVIYGAGQTAAGVREGLRVKGLDLIWVMAP
jgi:Bacteriophage lambda head decoration protein D